jgi:hypothetical protein
MTSKRPTGKTAATSLRLDSSDNSAETRDIPRIGESAPGDALYETLEDFVFDQSEGEDSSDDDEGPEKSGGGVEQNKVSEGDGEGKEATGLGRAGSHNDGDNTDNQTPQLPATTQRKRKRRDGYTADEDLVLYLLHTHVSLQHDTRVEVFNRVFHGQGVVREKGALVMQWFRFKDDYKRKFAKLSTAELAEHEAWKQKIDKAMKDACIASRNDGKQDDGGQDDGEQDDGEQGDGEQDDETDSADDQASHSAPPGQRRETRARYTIEHEIVMHILRGRKNIDSGTSADIFNHIFRAEGVVRNKVAIGKHWGRFKDVIQKRIATLGAEEVAVYAAWEQEVDDTIEELSGRALKL